MYYLYYFLIQIKLPMKKIIFIAIAMCSIILISCKKETAQQPDELAGLTLLQKMANDTTEIEVYTRSGTLTVGYNDIFFRVKNKLNDEFVSNAVLDWMPIMHMTMMSHAAPKSPITKVAGKEFLYKGFIVFQMPGNDMEKWTLSIDVQTPSITTAVLDTFAVANSTQKRVTSFTGSDSKKYILALVSPENPAVATNDLTLGLFVKETSMSYPAVTDATILFDPRMPDMGNHTSPNNVQPIINTTDNLYHGKVSLSMTGYWKLNFIVKNASDVVLKGEEISPSVESSSLYLELEF